VKNGMTAIANSLVRQIWNQRYYMDYSYMIIARESAPIMCYDEEVEDSLEESVCQLLMGYSLRFTRLLPPKDMANVFIHSADE
jgi:hypothetical protein